MDDNFPRDEDIIEVDGSQYIKRSFLEMEGGKRVLRDATNYMAESIMKVMGYENLKDPEFLEKIANVKIVPHQATR